MDDVEEIKRRLNIVDFIQSYLPLKKAGSGWKGLCPFHQEKTPSFHVNPERQIFKCFGCNEAGDVFDFVMKMEHLTFPEALQLLADRAGVIIDKRKTKEQYLREKDEKSRLYEINKLAMRLFVKILLEHPKAAEARVYLRERGLNEETTRRFYLGYAPLHPRGVTPGVSQFLFKRGFSENELRKAGSPDRFSNRLVFPLFDALGNPVGFTGRALDPDDQPKYLNTPETPIFKKSRLLYPLHLAKDGLKATGRAVLVEGQMDVLLAHQLGTSEAVATSGTALTDDHLRILSRYTNQVLLAFDQDQAGSQATRKAIGLAYALELEPLVVTLPAGVKDLGDLALKDPAAWPVALKAAQPAFLWLLEMARKSVPDPDSASGKKAIAKLALQALAAMVDPIERMHWLQVLARTIKIPERQILEALERVMAKTEPRFSKEGGHPSEAPAEAGRRGVERLTADELLLGLLIAFPEHLKQVAVWLVRDLFPPASRADRLAKLVASGYTLSEKTDKNQLLSLIKSSVASDEGRWLDQLLAEVERLHGLSDPLTIRNEIDAGFARLRSRQREGLKETMAQKIAQAESTGDRSKVQALMGELQKMLKSSE